MRSDGSDAAWFTVEFLIYYSGNKLRAFGYVRRDDGEDIPDGEYDVRVGLDERRRIWKKLNGEWKVKWRKEWDRKGRSK